MVVHPVDVCEIRPRLTERFFNAPLLGQGGDQREGQNDERNAGHHQRQTGLIETGASRRLVDWAVSGKDGRSHRRVVHTGNRHTHDDAATRCCPGPVVRNASHRAAVDAPIAMTTESATKRRS